MGAVETLRAWGILRPEITVRAAQVAGLELAAACVVLMNETGGGRMVWGSDGRYSTPPARRTDAQGRVIYEFGGPVTPDNYLRFRAAQRAGIVPRQGVGDCQLTSEEYIARAEQIGGPTGPADPYVNQLAGFTGLARLIRAYGDRGGFRRYNGSGDRAEAYADKAMAALVKWRDRIGSTPTLPPPAVQEDDDMTPEQDRILRAVHDELFRRHRTRVDYGLLGEDPPTIPVEETPAGFSINSDARAYETRQLVLQLHGKLDKLPAGGGGEADPATAAELAGMREAIDRLAAALTPDPAAFTQAVLAGLAAKLAAT